MDRTAHGPQIYIALVLAAVAATVTLPRDAVAHYRALASVVMQAFTLEGQVAGATELSLP